MREYVSSLLNIISKDIYYFQKNRLRALELAMEEIEADWNSKKEIEDNLYYSLLHHTIYQLNELIKSNNYEKINESLALWNIKYSDLNSLINTSKGELLVLDKLHCYNINESLFLDNPYTVTTKALKSLPPCRVDLVKGAFNYINYSNLNYYLEQGLSILVLLDYKTPEAITRSYSISVFPETVFTDWTDDDFRLGECILHEATHSWFNYALNCYKENLNSQKQWYSPWKEQKRPAFGILHAAMSFSVLLQYFKYIESSDYLPIRARQYASARLESELVRMREAYDSIMYCNELIKNEHLKSVVESEVKLSLH